MNSLFSLACAVFLLHPVHETVTEVEWNSVTKRLEVAIRLDADDERWIREKVGADADAEVSEWAVGYLRKRFRVAELAQPKLAQPKPAQPKPAQPKLAEPAKADKSADPTTYHWIGRDREGAYAWWYFEIEAEGGGRPEWVDVKVLYDREPDFLHRVLVLGKTPPLAINVTGDKTRVELNPSSSQRSP